MKVLNMIEFLFFQGMREIFMKNLESLEKFAEKDPKYTDLIPPVLYEVCHFLIVSV